MTKMNVGGSGSALTAFVVLVASASCSLQHDSSQNSNSNAGAKIASSKDRLLGAQSGLQAAALTVGKVAGQATFEAKDIADRYAEATNSRMLSDRIAIASKSYIYDNAGGAGVAARLAAEEAMRGRAIGGLKKAKSVIEAGIKVDEGRLVLLRLVRQKANIIVVATSAQDIIRRFANLSRQVKKLPRSLSDESAFVASTYQFGNAVSRYNAEATAQSVARIPESVKGVVLAAGKAEHVITTDATKNDLPNALATKSRIGFSKAEYRQIATYGELDESCRSSPSDGSDEAAYAQINGVCAARDRLSNKMRDAGLCYGSVDDASSADYKWHRCAQRSLADQ